MCFFRRGRVLTSFQQTLCPRLSGIKSVALLQVFNLHTREKSLNIFNVRIQMALCTVRWINGRVKIPGRL